MWLALKRGAMPLPLLSHSPLHHFALHSGGKRQGLEAPVAAWNLHIREMHGQGLQVTAVDDVLYSKLQ